jgi:hypothetical protein
MADDGDTGETDVAATTEENAQPKLSPEEETAKAQEDLATFLDNNKSAYVQYSGDPYNTPLVYGSWGDDSIVFAPVNKAHSDALNHLYLPERFTAVWHRTGGVILPTISNFQRLQAWVPLVAAAARDVMVYRGSL